MLTLPVYRGKVNKLPFRFGSGWFQGVYSKGPVVIGPKLTGRLVGLTLLWNWPWNLTGYYQGLEPAAWARFSKVFLVGNIGFLSHGILTRDQFRKGTLTEFHTGFSNSPREHQGDFSLGGFGSFLTRGNSKGATGSGLGPLGKQRGLAPRNPGLTSSFCGTFWRPQERATRWGPKNRPFPKGA